MPVIPFSPPSKAQAIHLQTVITGVPAYSFSLDHLFHAAHRRRQASALSPTQRKTYISWGGSIPSSSRLCSSLNCPPPLPHSYEPLSWSRPRSVLRPPRILCCSRRLRPRPRPRRRQQLRQQQGVPKAQGSTRMEEALGWRESGLDRGRQCISAFPSSRNPFAALTRCTLSVSLTFPTIPSLPQLFH